MTKQIILYSTGLRIHNPNILVEVETVIRPTLPIVPNYAYYLHEDKLPFVDLDRSYHAILPYKHRLQY